MLTNKSNKSFFQFGSLLFLVMALSVGVAIASGKSAVLTSPKAASCTSLGGSCLNISCCPDLQASFKNGQCTCNRAIIDSDCRDISDNVLFCQRSVIYKCVSHVKVKVKDCGAIGKECADITDGLANDCTNGPKKNSPISTPKPKVESGCGNSNYPACSSGTCSKGYACRKSGGSCGCIKDITK